MIQTIQQTLLRIASYNPLVVLLEFAALWLFVYLVFRFLRGTRGARVIKGLALLLIVMTAVVQLAGQGEYAFERLAFLYQYFLEFLALAVIIVFQPELRRAFVRLGETRFLGGSAGKLTPVADEIADSVGYLSKNKIGALIALERQVGLGHVVEGGVRLDATVSRQLLNTIFWPGSALHDMGVIVRGERVVAAGVQFPLAELDDPSSELGSRHRAAIGLSQDTDALVLIVSEETGTISVAERGQLTRRLTVDELRARVAASVGSAAVDTESVADGAAKAEIGSESPRPGTSEPSPRASAPQPAPAPAASPMETEEELEPDEVRDPDLDAATEAAGGAGSSSDAAAASRRRSA